MDDSIVISPVAEAAAPSVTTHETMLTMVDKNFM
jgi:hypothetical protein